MDEPECQFRIWWSMLVFVHVVSSHNEPETQKRSRKIVLDWIESYDYYQPSRNSQEKPGPSSGINFLILLTDPPLLRDVEYLIWRVRKGSTIDSLMRQWHSGHWNIFTRMILLNWNAGPSWKKSKATKALRDLPSWIMISMFMYKMAQRSNNI